MGFSEIMSLITEKSVTVAVLAYFIFRDYKFMGQLQNTLQCLVDTVNVLKDKVNDSNNETEDDGK